MRRLLYLIFLFAGYVANGQTTTNVKGRYSYQDLTVTGTFTVPHYTTATRPAPGGRIQLIINDDSAKLQYTVGSSWVTLNGTAGSGTLTPGYGISIVSTTIKWDSAAVRKVDTVIVTNDSTLQFTINGVTRTARVIRGNGVKYSDTTAMLAPYLRKFDTTAMLSPYLRKIDTFSISSRINLKVNISDTAAMLAPYLRKIDTASLSSRINLKLNITDTTAMLSPYLRKTDTASLSSRVNQKLNISDTAAMIAPYLRKIDTASLSNRINTKGSVAGTAGQIAYISSSNGAYSTNFIYDSTKPGIVSTSPYYKGTRNGSGALVVWNYADSSSQRFEGIGNGATPFGLYPIANDTIRYLFSPQKLSFKGGDDQPLYWKYDSLPYLGFNYGWRSYLSPGSSSSFVLGHSDTVWSLKGIVLGSDNRLGRSAAHNATMQSNTIIGTRSSIAQGNYNIVIGIEDSLSTSGTSFVVGSQNNAQSGSGAYYIFGSGNVAANTAGVGSFIGTNNSTTSGGKGIYSLIGGSNKLKSTSGHLIGSNLILNTVDGVVVGKYNDSTATTKAFAVGYGTSSNRRDIFWMDTSFASGLVYFSSDTLATRAWARANGSGGGSGPCTGCMINTNNLSDVSSPSVSRTNLGLGTAATQNVSAFFQPANNFSEVVNAATARTNLGLGSAATQANSFFMQTANNGSDVANAATFRNNIGLGSIATKNTITLTTDVTGILPIPNGGLNRSTAILGIVQGDGSSTYGNVIIGPGLSYNTSTHTLSNIDTVKIFHKGLWSIYPVPTADSLWDKGWKNSPSIAVTTGTDSILTASLITGTNGKGVYFTANGLGTAKWTMDTANTLLTLDDGYTLKGTLNSLGITQTLNPAGELKYLMSDGTYGRVYVLPVAAGGSAKGTVGIQSSNSGSTRSSSITVAPDSILLGTARSTGLLTTYLRFDSTSMQLRGGENASSLGGGDSALIIRGNHFYKVPTGLFSGTGMISPMTSPGDMIYGGTSGTPQRLAPGTATQLLHSGTTPTWSAVSLASDVTGTLPPGNGGTGVITPTTLTDGATITWNINNGINATVTIAATGRTLTITNPVAGQVYILRVKQDATGGRTITTWPSGTLWSGGTAPTLSTGANAVDIISFYYDGTNYYGLINKAFS